SRSEFGAYPIARGSNGETPLMMAARNGSVAAIEALVAAGAEVDAVEPLRGTTALMWAAEQRRAEAVSALIAHGADVNRQSKLIEIPNRRGGRVSQQLFLQNQATAAAQAGAELDEAAGGSGSEAAEIVYYRGGMTPL